MNIEYTKAPNPKGDGWVVTAVFKMERSVIIKDEADLEAAQGALEKLISMDLFSGSKWAAVRCINAALHRNPMDQKDAETVWNPESAIIP